jgi:DNA-binding transcriptional MerR regulator
MPTYTITELAEEFAITPRAIRFYEDHGILNPKREGVGGRHRVYPARDRTRLKPRCAASAWASRSPRSRT